jgi:hypothetical protein
MILSLTNHIVKDQVFLLPVNVNSFPSMHFFQMQLLIKCRHGSIMIFSESFRVEIFFKSGLLVTIDCVISDKMQ